MTPPLGNSPGNGPMPVLKQISRTMPSQNSGIAYRVRVTPVLPRSKPPPRRQPLLMPIRMPMTADTTVAVPSRTSVGCTRSPMTSQTGRENWVESTPAANGLVT